VIRGSAAARKQRRSWTLPAAGLVGVAVLAGIAWWMGWLGGTTDPVPAFTVGRVTTSAQGVTPTLSPDGEWIAFTRFNPAGGDVFLQSLGDQTAVQLTRDLGPVGFPAFSPDGTLIAFSQNACQGGVYVMGRMGGNLRRLTSRGFNPSWSPDGTKITFALELAYGNPYFRGAPNRELITVDVATGQETATGIRDGVQPAWSPNGHRIAYWGVDEQAWRDIYTTAAGETERVPVTRDVHVDHSPVWSPDGQWLYFASTRGGPMAIWRVRIDERTGRALGDPQAVTAGGLSEPAFFSFSRDGRRMVYQELLAQSRIGGYEFDPDRLEIGAARTPVVDGSRRLVEMDVSPDGEWIVYRTEDAQQDIYVVRANGSDTRQLTNDVAKDWAPRWSPDSRRLAFYSNASGRYQIWVMNRDGSGRIRLTNASVGNTYEPVWSPDGREIMYIESGVDSYIVRSDVPFDQQQPRLVPKMTENGKNLIVRASDWSGLNQMVAVDGVRLYSPATNTFESLVIGGLVINPRWMHDGRRVYYRRGPGWVALDIKTRAEQRIAGSDSVEGTEQLVLSADSRRAYLLSLQVQGDVWRMDIK
jgi:Tol biopolymer transport system component